MENAAPIGYLLFFVLLLIAYFIYAVLKELRLFLRKGRKPGDTDNIPDEHFLEIRLDRARGRWVLANVRAEKDLAGLLRVKPGDTITYSIGADTPITQAHIQFPSQSIFNDFNGTDCFIPNPIEPNKPQILTVREGDVDAGIHVYSICIRSDIDLDTTPYVLGGTPPKMEVIPD